MSGYRILSLAVCLMLAGIATASDDWHKLATLTASGKAKEVPVNREVSAVRFTVDSGTVVLNTVVVREGAKATPHRVAIKLNATESRDYDLGAKLHVTGLRISDSDKGTYTVYVK
jgi:hypothetical protein